MREASYVDESFSCWRDVQVRRCPFYVLRKYSASVVSSEY